MSKVYVYDNFNDEPHPVIYVHEFADDMAQAEIDRILERQWDGDNYCWTSVDPEHWVGELEWASDETLSEWQRRIDAAEED